MIKPALLALLTVTALAGCGAQGAPAPSAAAQEALTASATIQEKDYQELSVKALEAIACGATGNKCTGEGPDRTQHVGKKYKATGKINVTRIFNDKLINLTYYTTLNGWLKVDKRTYVSEKIADRYRDKIGAAAWGAPEPTVTVYLTVLPPGEDLGFRLDAVKRPDGKLVKP